MTTMTTDTADIIIRDTNHFLYCKELEHLGTTFSPFLKDKVDIKKRIKQAAKAFAAMKKHEATKT